MRTLWAVSLLLGTTAGAEGTRITVDDAIQAALSANDQLRAAQQRHGALEDQARSVRGHLLPSVNLSDEQDHYNGPFAIAFGPLSVVARNVNTNQFAAVAAQPVIGLLHISQEHAAASSSADSADAQTKVIEAAIREGVQTGFLRLFEARATQDIAKASEQELSEQVAVANSKLKAGVLTTADVLRVQVAQANAKQQEIQALAQEQVARASLLTAMGRDPADSSVDFQEPTALEVAAVPKAAEQDLDNLAVEKRAEVAKADLELDAAQHSTQRARLYSMLPELNVTAAYTHINGEILAPADQEWIGLVASWPIWQWGADWYAKEAADGQADAAASLAEDQRRQVRLDASTKLANLRAAAYAVDTAQATIASAEEAFRVTEALVKAGSATTTDLLDSQSALTQARLNLVRAKYEQAIAQVALSRATGS